MERIEIIKGIAKNLHRIGADWPQLFSHYHKQGLFDCSNQELKKMLQSIKKIKLSLKGKGRPSKNGLDKLL